jgi:hypothetical protein
MLAIFFLWLLADEWFSMIVSHVSTELEIDLNQAKLRARPETTEFGLRQHSRSVCRLGWTLTSAIVTHRAIAEPKPTRTSRAWAEPQWVGRPRRPFAGLSGGAGAQAIRIMKIFHSVTFVEGIINDFSFYTQIVFAEDLFLGGFIIVDLGRLNDNRSEF